MSNKTGIVKKSHRIYLVVKEDATNGSLVNADKLLELLDEGYQIQAVTPSFRTGNVHYLLEQIPPEILGQMQDQAREQIEQQIMGNLPPEAQDGTFHVFPAR